jgi:hypothetical protein
MRQVLDLQLNRLGNPERFGHWPEVAQLGSGRTELEPKEVPAVAPTAASRRPHTRPPPFLRNLSLRGEDLWLGSRACSSFLMLSGVGGPNYTCPSSKGHLVSLELWTQQGPGHSALEELMFCVHWGKRGNSRHTENETGLVVMCTMKNHRPGQGSDNR